MTERVTLFRKRRPSDNSDEMGQQHPSLMFNDRDLPTLCT